MSNEEAMEQDEGKSLLHDELNSARREEDEGFGEDFDADQKAKLFEEDRLFEETARLVAEKVQRQQEGKESRCDPCGSRCCRTAIR